MRRTTVGRAPALLLRVADYPDGGVHGGHLALVWNQDGSGYTLSLHFADRSRRTPGERETALLETARTMRRFTRAGLR